MVSIILGKAKWHRHRIREKHFFKAVDGIHYFQFTISAISVTKDWNCIENKRHLKTLYSGEV